MPDANPIEKLQRRLLELGCPVKATRKIVRESAEHFDDLQRSAIAQGRPAAEATTLAVEQLGNPEILAERHIEALRNSSWWGRHPLLGFALLPVIIAPVIWVLIAALSVVAAFLLTGASHDLVKSDSQGVLTKQAALFVIINVMLDIGLVLLASFFFWRAWRAALGLKWALTAGVVISLYSLFLQVYLGINPAPPYSTVTLGFMYMPSGPSLVSAMSPLIVVAVWAYRRWRHINSDSISNPKN